MIHWCLSPLASDGLDGEYLVASLFSEEHCCETEVPDRVQHNKGNSSVVSPSCNNFQAETLISCSMDCAWHAASPSIRRETWPCRSKTLPRKGVVMSAATHGSLFSLKLWLVLSFYLYTHTYFHSDFFHFCVSTDTSIRISLSAIAAREAVKPAGGTKNSTGRSLPYQPGSLHTWTNVFPQK